MKAKWITFLLLTLCLLVFCETTIFAKTNLPTVIYNGASGGFSFDNTEGTDLFPKFKGLMPGDNRSQTILLQAENLIEPTDFYLHARSSASDADALEPLTLTVYKDEIFVEKTIATGSLLDPLFLGTFESRGEVKLNVELEVPITVGNELAEAEAEIQWIFTAQTSDTGYIPPAGDGNDEGPVWHELSYASNGGTEYKDEYYSKGAVVQLDKIPERDGFIFTGWYADEELTEKITEIKMNSDKTVYAGWHIYTVPEWLNGDDHFAYVIGYTDDTVRPMANITRAETATIFFRLLKEDVREASLTSVNSFSDVPEGTWFNKPVSTMAALDIVKGRTGNKFDPNAAITRAEFAAICARFDTGVTEGDSVFTDISGHWAEEEIKRAAALGWIFGYPDGTFRPDQYITRAEAMSIINRVLNRIPEEPDDLLNGMKTWPDNLNEDNWYYLPVQEATNSHNFVYKGAIYESWTELKENPDWAKYG